MLSNDGSHVQCLSEEGSCNLLIAPSKTHSPLPLEGWSHLGLEWLDQGRI